MIMIIPIGLQIMFISSLQEEYQGLEIWPLVIITDIIQVGLDKIDTEIINQTIIIDQAIMTPYITITTHQGVIL